jgi:macrodomain Ter protein organizer (MatP/YcbG family)
MSETRENSKHIAKALSDEPLFVLMGRDEHAPKVIIEWIKESLSSQPSDKLHDALDQAINMAIAHKGIIEKKKQAEREFRRVRTGDFGPVKINEEPDDLPF